MSASASAYLIGREQVVDQLMHVESDDLGNVEQLDNIDAATTALDLRDDGLIAAEFSRESGLAQPGAVALLDKKIDQADMTG